ncbi:MAG: hypothetical protein WED00_15780 [Aquisalimonadaceae bacterium]
MDQTPTHSAAGGLHCLGDLAPPAEVTQGYAQMVSLPDHAIQALLPLLDAVLQAPQGDHAAAAQQFATQHRVDVTYVLAALQTCNYLLRQAAALNVSAEEFQQDLDTLGPGVAGPAQLLLPAYRDVTAWLRNHILEDTLADHGNVLTAVDWRVDQVHASNRGAALDARVVHLRLTYRSGDEIKNLSLQLTPNAVATLSDLLSQFSGHESTATGEDRPPA